MEYERIHKVQSGIISPSKLRMKLIGSHHYQKKKVGSNCNSSRTSPSRLEDSEFVNNSLLANQSGDVEEQYSNLEIAADILLAGNSVINANQDDENSNPGQSKGNRVATHVKKQQVLKMESGNASSVHPVKGYDDENLDYDSTSSFEFHKGERSTHHHSITTRSFSRPMSSKWNDAEKWIMNRQNVEANSSKKVQMPNQANRAPTINALRVAPDFSGYDCKLAVKRVDLCETASHTVAGKFAFANSGSQSLNNGENALLVDLCPETKDLSEVDKWDSSCTKISSEDKAGLPAVRSVCMRDMGTEMTPIPSQEPSRTATPLGATTPFRSPISSIPSTPRRGEPAPTPDNCISNASQNSTENTRRDIVALGIQLGKMNIAAWASKVEKSTCAGDPGNAEEVRRTEYSKSAAAWEEAEKSKHTARFKREEVRIQAWESRKKAALEAKMKKIEVHVEQKRAHAKAKIVKKITMARQTSEKKRAAAEARRNRLAEKTSEQAEYIRQTGRLPSSSFMCCGWSL